MPKSCFGLRKRPHSQNVRLAFTCKFPNLIRKPNVSKEGRVFLVVVVFLRTMSIFQVLAFESVFVVDIYASMLGMRNLCMPLPKRYFLSSSVYILTTVDQSNNLQNKCLVSYIWSASACVRGLHVHARLVCIPPNVLEMLDKSSSMNSKNLIMFSSQRW